MRQAILVALGALAAVAPRPAAAEDRLPLERGFYVTAGTPCGRASNSTLMRYDGQGFNVSQLACRITELRRQGEAYLITERCREVRSGDAMTARARVTPQGSTAFLRAEEGATPTRYLLCPAAQLPEPWRSTR